MSRRKAAPKREIMADPVFESETITKFINHVMKDGKKSVAEKIVYGALDKLGTTLNKLKKSGEEGESKTDADKVSSLDVFNSALDNVRPSVEVKSRRVGGSTYQVPVEVRPVRRTALAMRWLVDAAKKRSEDTMSLRLAGEIADAYEGKGVALKKKDDTHRMAKANQAFAHYRW